MLSNLFIFLVGLLLAIQGAKSLVTIDPISCAPYNVKNALDELVDMAQTAFTRTGTVFKGQGSKDERRVVFNTFNAYFSAIDPRTTAGTLLGI